MIRKLLSATLFSVLVASASCVAGQDAGLLIGNVRGFDEDGCSPRDEASLRVTSGFVDLAGTTRYVGWLELISQFEVLQRQTTEDPVEVPNANDAIVDRVHLSYRTEGDGAPSLSEEQYPLHFVVAPASGSSENLLGTDFLGPAAQTALEAVAPGSSFTVYTTISVSGRLRSGRAFESAEITFPISVIRSAGCPAGQVPGLTGPCGGPGGQDSFRLVCCPEENPLCANEETE